MNIKGDCYICTLETNELSKCKCKNMFLHLKCQLKLVDVKKDTRCSICLEEYSNLNVIIVKKKKLSYKSKILLLFIIIEIIVFGGLIFELSVLLNIVDNDTDYTEDIDKVEEYVILGVIIFFSLLLMIGFKPIYSLMKYIIINKSFYDIKKTKIINIKFEEDINTIL